MHVVHVCMYVYACMHDMYVCYVMYLHVWYCWLCIRIRARHVLMGQWDGATWRGNWTYNTGTKDFDRITSSSSSSYVKFSFVFSCHLFFFFFFQEKLPPFRVYLRVRVRVRVRACAGAAIPLPTGAMVTPLPRWSSFSPGRKWRKEGKDPWHRLLSFSSATRRSYGYHKVLLIPFSAGKTERKEKKGRNKRTKEGKTRQSRLPSLLWSYGDHGLLIGEEAEGWSPPDSRFSIIARLPSPLHLRHGLWDLVIPARQ